MTDNRRRALLVAVLGFLQLRGHPPEVAPCAGGSTRGLAWGQWWMGWCARASISISAPTRTGVKIGAGKLRHADRGRAGGGAASAERADATPGHRGDTTVVAPEDSRPPPRKVR
jgi:hypothetical protein